MPTDTTAPARIRLTDRDAVQRQLVIVRALIDRAVVHFERLDYVQKDMTLPPEVLRLIGEIGAALYVADEELAAFAPS